MLLDALRDAGRLDALSARVRHYTTTGAAMLGEAPTLDLGLLTLAHALALPRGAAGVLFALGRVAGWVAHIFEQRATDALLRPRARYVGL
jgi:citrate synthase